MLADKLGDNHVIRGVQNRTLIAGSGAGDITGNLLFVGATVTSC
jgi:hypothetical protein